MSTKAEKGGTALFCKTSSMQAWNPRMARTGRFRRPGVGLPAGWSRLDPGGTKCSWDAKSRKLVISVCFGRAGRNGQKGRVGPPESVEKPEKPGKAGKHRKVTFLRGTRATGRPQAHSVPVAPSSNRSEAWHIACQSPLSTMRGYQGSWSPDNVIGHLDGDLRVPGLSRPGTGDPEGSQSRMHGVPSKLGTRWIRRRPLERPALGALLEIHGSAPGP